MTKVISLSDEAYARLKELKKGGESFSDVVIELSGKKSLADFAGRWHGPKKELNSIEKAIMRDRLKSKWRENDTGL